MILLHSMSFLKMIDSVISPISRNCALATTKDQKDVSTLRV
jgi:hypothetical protein